MKFSKLGFKILHFLDKFCCLSFLAFSGITPENLEASNSGMGKVDGPID